MKPIEALEKLILYGLMYAGIKKRGPGEIIKSADSETKEAIQNLKSDDIKDIRIK